MSMLRTKKPARCCYSDDKKMWEVDIDPEMGSQWGLVLLNGSMTPGFHLDLASMTSRSASQKQGVVAPKRLKSWWAFWKESVQTWDHPVTRNDTQKVHPILPLTRNDTKWHGVPKIHTLTKKTISKTCQKCLVTSCHFVSFRVISCHVRPLWISFFICSV